jgi:hypothetical protein
MNTNNETVVKRNGSPGGVEGTTLLDFSKHPVMINHSHLLAFIRGWFISVLKRLLKSPASPQKST